MPLNYGQILKRAFEITKNNRSLWLFGILVAIFNTSGNFTNIPNFNYNRDSTSFPKVPIPKIDPDTIMLIIAIAALAFLVFVFLAIFVTFLARGALVGMVNKLDQEQAVSIKDGFLVGLSYILPLLAIGFLIWTPFVVGLLILAALTVGPGVLLILAEAKIIGIVLVVLGFLFWLAVVIVLAIALMIISLLAARFLIIGEKGIIGSINEGYRLLRNNLGPVLLVWLINLGIGFGQGIIFAIIIFIMVFPITMLAMFTSPFLFILLIIPFAGLVFIGGLFETFFSSLWTITYRRLTYLGDGSR